MHASHPKAGDPHAARHRRSDCARGYTSLTLITLPVWRGFLRPGQRMLLQGHIICSPNIQLHERAGACPAQFKGCHIQKKMSNTSSSMATKGLCISCSRCVHELHVPSKGVCPRPGHWSLCETNSQATSFLSTCPLLHP